MKDFITLIAEHLKPERLHQMERALSTMRDCAKEAMANARTAGNDRASEICLGAYQATCRQLKSLEQVLKTKEGD
jgi:hypothetical protein